MEVHVPPSCNLYQASLDLFWLKPDTNLQSLAEMNHNFWIFHLWGEMINFYFSIFLYFSYFTTFSWFMCNNGMLRHSLATLEGCNLLWHIVAPPPLFHPSFCLQGGVLKNIDKFSMGKFNKGGSCKIQLPKWNLKCLSSPPLRKIKESADNF